MIHQVCGSSFFFFLILFFAVLGLHYCTGFSLAAVHGLLIAVVSLITEHGSVVVV